MQYTTIYKSPLGNLGIKIQNQQLTNIDFLFSEPKTDNFHDPFVDKICQQLDLYFQNPSHPFSIPIQSTGTEFQNKVWKALVQIPSGETVSYKELAIKLNTSPRAIGNACRTNRMPIIIPCHRVIAKNGLGGFAGDTSGKLLEIKKWLLNHEAVS